MYHLESTFPTAIYSPSMDLTPLDPPTETPWIPVDPLHPNLERFPRFKYARPIVVKVKAGEMLYLPGELHTSTCRHAHSLFFSHILSN